MRLEKGITIETGQEVYDTFSEKIKSFLFNNVREFYIHGKVVRGYRSPDTSPIWLRDHTHQMKGFKYFEKDMKSSIDHFLENQTGDGNFYDFVRRTGEHKRAEMEPDVEYLMVEAVHTVWQVTGDDEWMQFSLPKLEKALRYSMSHPWRWAEEYGLVKRPFTIDTWDFVYNPMGERHKGHEKINVHYEKTDYCIMHGDNSGMYQAAYLLAKMFNYFGDTKKRDYWSQIAEDFREKVNKICWNGKFYTHQIHITPIEVKGVDEGRQLSLSNTYDMNRGIASHEQCVSIIREYMKRREETKEEYFAEWFSLHPPFPDFSFHANPPPSWTINAGWYVNGGVLPLVGGELAKACFKHGFEDYGLDILKRYYQMISSTNATYLWYHPDGQPGVSSEQTLPTDGWGAAAMLSAFMEGLAGVRDNLKLFQEVSLSPRWVVTGQDRVRVNMCYECSRAFLDYEFNWDKEAKKIMLKLNGHPKNVEVHLLLPRDTIATKVIQKESVVSFENNKVEHSSYVDFKLHDLTKKVHVYYG